MLKVLVVDDEPAARERLSRLLAAHPTLQVVGEAADGISCLEQVRSTRPDVLFLDIEMPGCSGLEVAASLPAGDPRIVFCTAYDQYALDAFDLRAVDYLLKPVQRHRLEETVRRLSAPAPALAPLPAPTRFLARDGERYIAVPAREVFCFLSADGLTRLVARREFLLDVTLNDLEARLPPQSWCRASRSALLHLPQVTEVDPMPGGSGEAVLGNGRRIEVSRRRLPTLLERLGRL
jgi:two-component system LytT family response regulator